MDKLTISEASDLIWKSEIQIRRLIKANHIIYEKTNQWYYINKSSLLSHYWLKEEDIINKNDYSSKNNKEVINQSFDIQPLLNNIVFLQDELNKRTLMLDTTKEEKEKMINQMNIEKEKIKEKFSQENAILSKKVNVYKMIILWLVTVFWIILLFAFWIIKINI